MFTGASLSPSLLSCILEVRKGTARPEKGSRSMKSSEARWTSTSSPSPSHPGKFIMPLPVAPTPDPATSPEIKDFHGGSIASAGLNASSPAGEPFYSLKRLNRLFAPGNLFDFPVIPYNHQSHELASHLATVGVDKVWNKGYSGKGVTIAILDTGYTRHPALEGRVLAFKDLVNGAENPYDDHGHGTKVAFTAAGDPRGCPEVRGPAYDANLVILKVCDSRGVVFTSTVIKALQWIIENKEKYNIKVLNMSFTLDDSDIEERRPIYQAMDQAVRAGLIPVAGAGNDGPSPGTIETLGSSPSVITVGAVDDSGTPNLQDDQVAGFSSRGPGEEGAEKPDVVAPGVGIPTPDRHLVCTRPSPLPGKPVVVPPNYPLERVNGTSFATPVTSGVIATWLEANPSLTFQQVKEILQKTSRPIPNYTSILDIPPDRRKFAEGSGLIDAARGLELALSLKKKAAA